MRIKKNTALYFMLAPVVLYYIIFHYIPMAGIQIAFRDYVPTRGFWGSEWVGLKYFERFFSSYYFERLLTNTLGISLYSIIIGTIIPITLAIMFYHIGFKNRTTKLFQTITYIPHFISIVVMVSIIQFFFDTFGIINFIFESLGLESYNFLSNPDTFWNLFVWTGVWQGAGWGTIIYTAAISSIPLEQFEAARIDGAGIFSRIKHIILPGILPTITILTILAIGNLMNVGFEKVLLLQNSLNMDSADVIATHVYQQGILSGEQSYATAVGLFNNIINLILLLITNRVAKRLSNTGLW